MSRPDPCNWTCQIGEMPSADLDAHGGGMDYPMRQAVKEAYKRIAGKEADYCFSGWGDPLPEGYRAVQESRLPDPAEMAVEDARRLAVLPPGNSVELNALIGAAQRYLTVADGVV